MTPFTGITSFILLIMLFFWGGCAQKPKLSPFKSDGCSLFPDKDYLEGDSWCHCCVAHDYKYWKGGSTEQRKAADKELKQCILDVTGDEALANAMYVGTRTGGPGYFPTTYRWGYGWPFNPDSVLTDQEKAAQLKKLDPVSLDSARLLVCGEK